MTRKFNFIFTLLLTMLFLSLSGCTGAAPITEEPVEEPTEEPAPEPEPAPVVETEEVDHCLDCHTDKENLVSTAKPVEVVVAESEGAG